MKFPAKDTRQSFIDFFLLTGLSSFFLLYRLGDGSIASWDEGIYASVAKELYQSGQWFKLTLGGSPWFDKPPLAIWATVLSYKLFGVNEFSARFFSALCGVGTVLVTYLLGKRLFGRWVGFLGAAVLMSSSHFIRFSRFGMLDAPLTLFLTLSLYFFWLAVESGRAKHFIFAGIAAALAILTKSFAAFLIFPIQWIYAAWAGEGYLLKRRSAWLGFAIAMGVFLAWSFLGFFIDRTYFMQEGLWTHLVRRTIQPLDGHAGNAYFYIRVLINKYHPWILVGVVSAPLFLFRAVKDRYREFVFLSVWMFFILAVTTLVRTKLAWYIIPAYPALSISVAYCLAKVFNQNQAFWVRPVFIGIMALHVPYSHIFDHDYSRPLKGLASAIVREVPEGGELGLYNYHEAMATFFYTDRKAIYIDSPEAFRERVKIDPSFVCLVRGEYWSKVELLVKSQGLLVAESFEDTKLIVKKNKPLKKVF